MITTLKDFKGEIRIPNLEELVPLGEGNKTELEYFIEKYEKKLLVILLGFRLYEEFMSHIDQETGKLLPNTVPKWHRLLNGNEDYIGLHELLANYIFVTYLQNDQSHYAGIGIIKEKSKGGVEASIRPKLVKAWRTFFELAVGERVNPMVIERSGSRLGIIWGDRTYEAYKPLRLFLLEKKDDYPTAVSNFDMFENTNLYGV